MKFLPKLERVSILMYHKLVSHTHSVKHIRHFIKAKRHPDKVGVVGVTLLAGDIRFHMTSTFLLKPI